MDEDGLALIREFKRRAQVAMPGRVADVVLFGSRARNEAEPDSDWDVAVFLSDGPRADDWETLADTAWDLIVESDHFIQVIPLDAAKRDEETLLMSHIRRDGVTI